LCADFSEIGAAKKTAFCMKMLRLGVMQVDFWVLVVVLVALVLSYHVGVFATKWRTSTAEKSVRRDATRRSRAVLTGQFSEQLAPYLPNFPYNPTEVRFVGKPIDYIVFEGLGERAITRVVFLEVKSGNAALNDAERSLRDAIQSGRVAFEVYHAPSQLARGARVG